MAWHLVASEQDDLNMAHLSALNHSAGEAYSFRPLQDLRTPC